MNISNYTQEPDYHAILMYDPWREQAENLGHELLMTKIDLAYESAQANFWRQMYQNQVETISNIA